MMQSAPTWKTYRALLKRCRAFLKTQRPFLKRLWGFFKTSRSFWKTSRSFLQHGSVSKLNRAIPSSVVGAGFACPKTQNKPFSGEQTSPLRTKRQHYPHFDPLFVKCVVCTYASVYTYGGISPHVRTHRPTRTYAWACTYICHCVRLRHILYPGLINLSPLLTNAFSCCIFVVRQI